MGPRQQNINEATKVVVVGQSTSIALLQERFKQLERVKVMREERELQLQQQQQQQQLRRPGSPFVPEASTDRPTKHLQQPNWPFLLRPSSPLSVSVPSSAGPASEYSTVGFFRPPPSMHNCWNSTVAEPADIVDTSLHL